MGTIRRAAATSLLLSLLSMPAAAETWATCTGTVASLPAVITTQGVWCVDRDLATAMSSGVAITIAANNVTLDCNGYKLGNLAAGVTTAAVGIQSSGRVNATIRGCHVRGFANGIHLTGSIGASPTSAGHLVEDNHVEASTTNGMLVKGLNSTIRRNRLHDLGLSPTQGVAGIAAIGSVDVVDNVVDGVQAAAGTANAVWGIYAQPLHGTLIGHNEIRGVLPALGFGWGIFIAGTDGRLSAVRDNMIVRAAPSTMWASCSPGSTAAVRDNLAMGWTTGSTSCYWFENIELP